MPDLNALIRLRKRLQTALETPVVLRSKPWVSPQPMRDALRAVEKSFDGVETVPEEQSLRGAVLTFLNTPHSPGFKELKYACFGVTLPFNSDEDRLIDRPRAFERLLGEVDGQQAEGRRFRRCYQALLQSYFAYGSKDDQAPSAASEPAFLTLRGFLTDRLEIVAKPIGGRAPGWALVLKEHSNLLTDRPCNRYTAQLAEGKTDELAEVCAGLGINRQSWVWQEVMLAYLREICDRPDGHFKTAIDTALDLAEGKSAIAPSAATARTVASHMARRYSDCTVHPELPRLRDACVTHIGNPWARRSAWDAWVRHEPARQMVDSWLKSKIMEDFFMLLSDQTGQATDRRRLQYWLKYVPVITDMWFVLGTAARRNSSPEFREILGRMEGRRPDLDPSVGDGNNAFIMRIGRYYFIEFGAKGNACYYYREDELPFDLGSSRLSIHKIKARKFQSKPHVPSASWEREFDRKFRPLMGDFSPTPTPSISPDPLEQPSVKGPLIASEQRGKVEIEVASNMGMRSAAGDPDSSPLHTPPKYPNTGHDDDSSAKELMEILARCKSFSVPYRDLRSDSAGVWIAESISGYASLRFKAISMGFKEIMTLDRRGYWLGRDVALDKTSTRPASPAPAPPTGRTPRPSEAMLMSLLMKCRLYGIRYEDFRARSGGGNLWIYTDPTTQPTLVEELKWLGFQFTSKRGYWLEGKDS